MENENRLQDRLVREDFEELLKRMRVTQSKFADLFASRGASATDESKNSVAHAQTNKPRLASVSHAQVFDTRSIPDDRVIVKGEAAKNVLMMIGEKGLIQSGKTMLSTLVKLLPFSETVLTWGDLRTAPNRMRSLLRLTELLSCGVSLSDLYGCGLARTYNDLRDIFDFDPTALAVNYPLCNFGMMRQYYQLTYADLIVNFSTGIRDLLLTLKLPLSDLNSAEITVKKMRKWRRVIRDTFIERGLPDPTQRRSIRPEIADLLQPLSLDMLRLRVKATREDVRDWVYMVSLTAKDLIKIGATSKDILSMWGSSHRNNINEIFEILGASSQEREAILNPRLR